MLNTKTIKLRKRHMMNLIGWATLEVIVKEISL